MEEHNCTSVESYPLDKFFQKGTGKGTSVLIVGESPAPNGWRLSGKACYTKEGKLLPTGSRLNEYLSPFDLSVETCGFTELVKCFVGKNRHQLGSCAKATWPIFIRQLAKFHPKLVIILGVKTTQILNRLVNGNLRPGTIEEMNLDGNSYRILPLYHPSPINPTGHQKNRQIFATLSKKLASLI